MNFVHTMISETGLRRSNNEDAVAFVKPEKPWQAQTLGSLWVVSDGMGGYERGEKASAMVVENLSRAYFNGQGLPAERLSQAAVIANNAVALEGKASSRKMGATCTAVVLLKDQLHFLHVGDSRAYIFRQGQLKQVTRDHTVAEELASSLDLRHMEQTMLINPHALTRAMGMDVSNVCHGDVFTLPNDLVRGDRVLLCSDGLYLHVNDQELGALLKKTPQLKELTSQLVKLVLQRGAHDNFSFIIIEIA